MDYSRDQLLIMAKTYPSNFREVMEALRKSDPRRWEYLYMQCLSLGIDYQPAKS